MEEPTKSPKTQTPSSPGGTTINKISLTPKQCPISTVTVFNDRAEVVRAMSVTAEVVGQHELVMGGLPSTIDEHSVHVNSGLGNATILEVSVKTTFEQDPEVTSEISSKREYHLFYFFIIFISVVSFI